MSPRVGESADWRDARVTINELLEVARRRLRPLEPGEARDAMAAGAVLVDSRSDGQREHDGLIPGAHVVARNVLEWRLDPASGHSDPALGADLDRHVILVCNEGYESSLAAATLQDLGFHRATDLAGGFQAWRATGLRSSRRRTRQVLNLRANHEAVLFPGAPMTHHSGGGR